MPSVVVVNQPNVQIASGSNVSTVSSAGRLQVETPGSSIISTTGLVRDFVWNSGSTYLRVNGATPKQFIYSASLTQNIRLNEIRIFMTADTIEMDGTKFGSHLALTSGTLIEIISSGSTGSIANIKVNEEFFLQSQDSFFDRNGTKDILMSTYGIGLILYSGSGDRVRVTVRDDLSTAAYNIRYFVGSISGEYIT